MPTTVEVTDTDIKRGDPGNTCSCPIARAIKRLVKPETLVLVGRGLIRVGNTYYKTTPRASSFVRKFDEGEPVKPFKFRINLLTEVLR